jgi:hypothetical protein
VEVKLATERDDQVSPGLQKSLLVRDAILGIHEKGTNFPTFVFDPDEYVQADY